MAAEPDSIRTKLLSQVERERDEEKKTLRVGVLTFYDQVMGIDAMLRANGIEASPPTITINPEVKRRLAK